MPLHIYIEPLDTLFFRDNRPFDAGVDTGAESVFPSPLTLFGIIGSYYLECNNKTIADISATKLGAYDETLVNTTLKIKGPFIALKNKLYFASPANMWASKGSLLKDGPLCPKDTVNYLTDIGQPCLRPMSMRPANGYVDPKPLDSYLPLEDIQKYLAIKLLSVAGSKKDIKELFTQEFRFGHTLDKTSNTVEEGMLYFTNHIRSKETLDYREIAKPSLVVEVEGLESTDISEGSARVGGEGRIARIFSDNVTDKLVPDNPAVREHIKQNKRFLVYLITPSIFTKGWYGNWDTHLKGAIMTGACVNKPVHLSGWMKNAIGAGGVPRPLYKAVPAGSVYFFEAPEWNDLQFEQMYENYHCNKSISDIYPAAGFGTAVIGAW